MIDTDKYEGHTEGPWWADEWFNDDVVQFERGYCVEQRIVNKSPIVDHSGEWVCLVDNEADAQLIADAPLLLEEVKRLRQENDELHAQRVQFSWIQEARGGQSDALLLLEEVKRLREDNELYLACIHASQFRNKPGSAMSKLNQERFLQRGEEE